ncbi:hypothetical protein AB0O10_17855 [Streptomyces lydicus]
MPTTNRRKPPQHAITPRRVSFDWRETPLVWIPGEPTATHVINVEGPARRARRILGMAVTAPVLLYLWGWGAAYLLRHDPQLAAPSRYSLRAHNRAGRRGLLPTWRELGAAMPRYLRRSYHPSQEGSLRTAVAYLASSPAARAAAGAVGRAAVS